MRLEAVKREVSSSGTMQVAKATIKATPKIFDMFANDTYANKPLAIMRELVANGIDAHVSAGRSDRPVEVRLPTSLDPTCVIRDFGTGMAHDFVMGPFMAYTDGSTKDKDNGAIGGFGIGSKSPFAYVDQYTLRVVHDGMLSVYTMFKDTDGIPAVGLQGQTTTTEPNGVEVSFPVEEADIEAFRKAAQDALQYFQPLPLVENGTLNGPDYTYVGNGWAMRPSAGELGVIMGGVRYPAAKDSMAYDLRTDKRLAPLLTYGLDLTLPIGSCGVAMSREQLSYIAKTSESIKAALSAVIDDVVATFANFFDNQPSEYEAAKLLLKEVGTDSYSRSGRAQLLLGNAKYNGNKLETGWRIEPSDFNKLGLNSLDFKGWWIEAQRGRRGTACPSPKWLTMAELYTITPGEIETVIIDDLPDSPKSKAVSKIRAYVDDTCAQVKRTLVIRGKQAGVLKLLRGPANYVLTSTLPEPQPKAKAAKSTRPRVRMFRFNGNKDRYTHQPIRNLTPAASKNEAVSEIKYVDQPSSGIMVVMNSFDLPDQFDKRMETQLVGYGELVFVNIADAPKIKATFRDFAEVFAERLAAALAKYPDLPARLAVHKSDAMQKYGNLFHDLDRREPRRIADMTGAAKTRPFGKLLAIWQQYVKPITVDQQRLAPFVTAALPAGVKPDAVAANILTQQPDIAILQSVLRFDKEDHRRLFFNNL